MNQKIELEPISRRGVLSILGLAGTLGLVTPVLMVSDAEAQTAGMERRQDRREGRRERREDRREGRQNRREDRREGRSDRREDRRTGSSTTGSR